MWTTQSSAENKSLISVFGGVKPGQRTIAGTRSSMRRFGGRRYSALPPARRRCSACGATRSAVHLALIAAPTAAELLVVSLPCPERRFPSVGATHPPALRLERAIPRSLRPGARSLARHPPLARSRPLGRAPAPRRAPSPQAPAATPTASTPPKARRCTRSQSARCTRALSNPVTSASPATARR